MLVAPRVNKAELLLLIDQDGSMIPFHALSHRLAETALRGGLLGKAGIYYFHNCPIEHLYHDSHLLAAELVSHATTGTTMSAFGLSCLRRALLYVRIDEWEFIKRRGSAACSTK